MLTFVLSGRLNTLVGKERRIVEPGTFVHMPAFARHSVKATEDGAASYLYVKDHTWSIVGIAADEAPPDVAPSVDDVHKSLKEGRWPGGAKETSKSHAIIEGIGDAFYPIVDLMRPPPHSAAREIWIHGERLSFAYVEPTDGDGIAGTAERERFIYLLAGSMTASTADETRELRAGDVVHLKNGSLADIAVAAPHSRYIVLQSSRFLEDWVEHHPRQPNGAADED